MKSQRKLHISALRLVRLVLAVVLLLPPTLPSGVAPGTAPTREEGVGHIYCQVRVGYSLTTGCDLTRPSASAHLVGTGGPVNSARLTIQWTPVSAEAETLEVRYLAAATDVRLGPARQRGLTPCASSKASPTLGSGSS